MNGVAKGGIITSFIGAGFCCIMGIIFLFSSAALTKVVSNIDKTVIIAIGVLLLVGPVLVIVFGSLALAKKTNGFKLACGIIALLCVVVAWAAYFVPLILFLVGGILTLCGKANN
ncbi:hypothetical protein [Spiroplasma turonicum]|uniref:DUF4064 domain-containing protein n=1 Tax=Spiroplasma turonicum TaxID=216946 RepID=A0A0K1P6V7_9MOLU|nr:hypothetical protein [Spiroplasma turonicum]AKU80005.1 hypothetical protein STURON_00759 [Spiroplasma turonicum]ALX71007.1 hypothetical protein STURO_v1c07560 [Spiroplasma turonicum]